MAAMRKRMQDGVATPQEIAEFERRGAAQAARMSESLNALVDTILEHRREPIVLTGMWAQHMAIIRRARELGVPDGAFHPESYISAGGGVKGVTLPRRLRRAGRSFLGARQARHRVRHDGDGAADAAM